MSMMNRTRLHTAIFTVVIGFAAPAFAEGAESTAAPAAPDTSRQVPSSEKALTPASPPAISSQSRIGTKGSGGTNTANSSPAGSDCVPPTLPRGAQQDGRIGNMEDVTGSMGDGSPKTATEPKPTGTDCMPPTLPRGAQQNGRIANMEDVTGSKGDGSAPKQ